MDLFLSILPIVILIWLMVKKNSMASHKALPLVAILMYLIKVLYFKSDITLINATVINGLLTAWTPILIIWGAIFLFHTMENTGGLKVIKEWLNGITNNKVAQLMIIGWAFAFLIEGASGFGTPAALAAPLLVGLGFKPVRAAILTLIMNSVPVTFGAIGTPIWFGLGELGLSNDQLLSIGLKSAIMHGAAALIIPIIALSFIVSKKEIKENIFYIYLSIFSCIIPYILLAQNSFEFPSIIGGMIGLILSIFFAKRGIGLKRIRKDEASPRLNIIKASFPLWGTTLILIITRIKEFGIKDVLISTDYMATFAIPKIGELGISSSAVIQFNNILGTGINWIHKTLYIPSIIPFFLISIITFLIFKTSERKVKKTWNDSWNKIKNPIIALLGALVFVKLLMIGGDDSSSMIIGRFLANLTGNYWQFFASYLGGFGSFFAGSNTISNLTFGGIQQSIAQNLNLNLTTILAAQSVGGAMGNMICINNIVAVCSVLGLSNKEGFIIKRTIIPMIIYGVIVGVISFLL